jgi:arylamine N-acetyltransferase
LSRWYTGERLALASATLAQFPERRGDTVNVSQPIAATLPATWTDRYLAMLGVERKPPSLEAVAEITRAHTERVMFGSIQSLMRRREQPEGPVPPMDFDHLLTTWENRTGTGVCFEVAAMVHRLLTELGYKAHVVLAGVNWWGGHQAVVVELHGRQWMVDAGNGAPFFDPVPLDQVFEIHHLGLGFRFRPGDEESFWIQDRFIDGEWQPFFTYDLRPAAPEERDEKYQRHHVHGESFVCTMLRLVRISQTEVASLGDATLTRYTSAGKTVEMIEDPAEYRRIAAEVFGAPDLPMDEARASLATLKAAAEKGS